MKKNLVKRRGISVLVAVTLLVVLLFSGAMWFVTRAETTEKNITTRATPHTSPTASIQATATALARPLFSDDFTNNKYGWSVGDVPGYTRAVQNNTLMLVDTHHSVLVESLPTSMTFRNFSLTTTFTLSQAEENDSVGLYLRGDSNLDHDYRIDIFGNNTYAISKESLDAQQNSTSTFLIPPTSSSFLNGMGQQNTLTVTMNDIELTMLLNGHLVGSITDADYMRGQIALFVSNSPASENTTALFYNISIYPVAESVSTQHYPIQPYTASILTENSLNERTGIS